MMSIKFIRGSTQIDIKDLFIGGNKISKVYYGSDIVYSKEHYASGTVLFESSTPGTYSLTLAYGQMYQIILVGAGGKGNIYHNPGSVIKNAASGGGGGAYVHGDLFVRHGTYNITVGGANGGSSSAFENIAGGGQDGYATSADSRHGGYGGTYIVTSGIVGESGNVGGVGAGSSATTVSGATSKYEGYGAGGGARCDLSNPSSEYANNGTNGYVKIVAK